MNEKENTEDRPLTGLKIQMRIHGLPMKKISEFENFQGQLKHLDKTQLAKLKASIVRNGYNAPVFIWKGHNYILDGHQRIIAVKSLMDRDEMVLVNDELPYVEIEASNERMAKEMILTYNSQYGDVSPEALADLLAEIHVPTTELDEFVALPDISLHDVAYFLEESEEYQIVKRDMEASEQQYLMSQGANSIWGVSKAYVRIGRYYFFIDHDMAEEIGLLMAEQGEATRGPKWFIKQILPELSNKRIRNIGPLWLLPVMPDTGEKAKRADEMTGKEIKESEANYSTRTRKEKEKKGRPVIEEKEEVRE